MILLILLDGSPFLIIGNFIDESSLAVYRQKQPNKGTYRLIFIEKDPSFAVASNVSSLLILSIIRATDNFSMYLIDPS